MSKLKTPAVIINFKAYTEVEGGRALKLAESCLEVAEESGVAISVCPPLPELSLISSAVALPVLAQHVDAKKPGSATGWVTPSMISAAGAAGSLLNHSEHRMILADLAAAVAACRSLELTTVVCTDTAITSAAAASLAPDFIAVEPPELIGGDVSVTEARPEVVSEAVAAVQKIDADIQVLCGAGVKTGKDVAKAIELGAAGVLLASGVVKAADPKAVLRDLVRYL
ncbi:triose-phosphate isomerase [Candidatus Methanomassiliicoccus intestinalis]|uniref:triose-phosphate isomerase n=1 Tax=Candidatus Methanomassiliicoccus intestinalis TaxID=1406512 RepID=UPI0037DC4097